MVIALTAFWLLRHTFSKEHFSTEEVTGVDAPEINISIDGTLQEINQRFPKFHPVFLTLPETENTPAYFYGHSDGVSFFYANYYDEIGTDGKSLTTRFHSQKSTKEKFESIIYPVHAGVYGNTLVKVIYSLGGLTPALLSITGFLLW